MIQLLVYGDPLTFIGIESIKTNAIYLRERQILNRYKYLATVSDKVDSIAH